MNKLTGGYLPELMFNLGLLQLGLEENLQGDDVFARLLSRQVHVSKLSFAQRTTNIEISQLPFNQDPLIMNRIMMN